MDGIGGTAKRGGNNFFVPFVKTAKDFAITGSAACPGIKFIYIGKAEVESKIKALDELAFTRAGVRHRGIGDESRARAL